MTLAGGDFALRAKFSSPARGNRRPSPIAMPPIAPFFIATCLIAATAAGCDDDAAALPPPGATTTEVASPPPPRRPTRRYYLARTSERCEIFAQDGDDRTEPFMTPCPDFLLVGERIRIVGMTCILENSAQPDRAKPVICPDPLTRFEKNERKDAGAPPKGAGAPPAAP